MWNFMKRLFFSRLTQRAAQGTARSLGAGSRLSTVIGLVAGIRHLRKHA